MELLGSVDIQIALHAYQASPLVEHISNLQEEPKTNKQTSKLVGGRFQIHIDLTYT